MFPTLSFGDQDFTPQEMSARSAEVAGAMAAIGLKEGDTIALMLRNEPTLMDVMLAARQLGLYFTPLNWHFKSEEAGYIMRDCGAKALFVHTDLFQQIADGIPPDVSVFALRPHPLTIAAYNIQEPARRIPDGTSDWAAVVAEAAPLATSATIPRGIIAYTSGTTGRPKGVRRFPPSPEEASAFAERMAQMFQRALGLTPDARCLISAVATLTSSSTNSTRGRVLTSIVADIVADCPMLTALSGYIPARCASNSSQKRGPLGIQTASKPLHTSAIVPPVRPVITMTWGAFVAASVK